MDYVAIVRTVLYVIGLAGTICGALIIWSLVNDAFPRRASSRSHRVWIDR